jgi:hypothetical protein
MCGGVKLRGMSSSPNSGNCSADFCPLSQEQTFASAAELSFRFRSVVGSTT